MIDLQYGPTPTGRKIAMFLEEIGPPCEIHAVDIGAGDQFKPAFLKFSPNNRLPAVTEEGKMLLFRQTAASVVR